MSGHYANRARLADEPAVTKAAMTFDEIAKHMGISKQLVWFYYCNALRKLRHGARLRQMRQIRALSASRDFSN